MSNRYEGIKCPVCNGYLFEDEDDIVVCPICGAPHHRSCYQSIGHCGLESLHGTDQQYDKAQRRQQAEANSAPEMFCPHCGKPISEEMLFCPYCGKMRDEAEQPEPKPQYNFPYDQLDPLGGVFPATDLGEGVTAKQAAEFVKVNTKRYIPKFASPSKTSWNWLAFLLPHSFFFFHKMYKLGFLVSAIYLTAIVLGFPAQAEYIQLLYSLPMNAEPQELLATMLSNGLSTFAICLMAAGFIINLALRIVCGMFADHWYKNHVIHSVKQLSALEPEEREQQYIKKGLPNFYLLIIITIAFSWLTNILYIILF